MPAEHDPTAAPAARRARDESGFTLIEVLVAATLLIIGVLATLSLLDNGARATSSSLQHDTGNSIAHEVIERAQGMQYTQTRNDLTDVRVADATPTPADRLRAAMDPTPDGARQSTSPTSSDSTRPWKAKSTWTLNRRNTTYTVTYKACTHSDVVQGLQIMGPYDCERGDDTTVPPPGTQTSNKCSLALLNGAQIKDQVAAGAKAEDITAQILLLSTLGVQACVTGTLDTLGLGDLVKPLCQVLGDGTNPLSTALGLLNSVLGPLGSDLELSVCPKANGAPASTDIASGIASSTQIETTVSWQDRGSSRRPTTVQSAVVRRPAS